MKILIKESQLDNAIDRLLKSKNVKYNVNYKQNSWDNYGNQFVEGTVWLYQDGNIFGYRFGYDFFFKVGFRKKLEYEGRYPYIEKLDFFKFMPSEVVIGFFSNKVKSYLEKGIEERWINVR
jgi:hypothetical protein